MSNTEKMGLEHPAQPIPYPDAVHYVERWLNNNCLPAEDVKRGVAWKIYDYYNLSTERAIEDRPWVGVRVSEVSVAGPCGGVSYMQVDRPWGLALCAQVERCILALIEGWNRHARYVDEDGGYMSAAETDEEFWGLSYLFEEMEAA